MDIAESDSPATLPGMPPGGDTRHNYIIAARPPDTSGTEDEQMARHTSTQDLHSIGQSQQLVEQLTTLRRLAEDFSAGGQVPLFKQLEVMETDVSARALHCIINIADEQADRASTGEYSSVENDVRRVRSLLDSPLCEAVCGLKGGADAGDVSDAIRQQLRLVRVGYVSRVKLHVIIGRSGDGWKKEAPFKPLEAFGAGTEAALLEGLGMLSLAWSITRPARGLGIVAFCARLGNFILERHRDGSSRSALGTYYASVMRRVDGNSSDLQRGDGPIARPIPQLIWIDGPEQPHVQLLARQTNSEARAETSAELVVLRASLEQKILGLDGKRRNDGSSEQTPSKKAKKEATASKKKKKQAAADGPTATTVASNASPVDGWRPASIKTKAQDELLAKLGLDSKGRKPCYFFHHTNSCRFDADQCYGWHTK